MTVFISKCGVFLEWGACGARCPLEGTALAFLGREKKLRLEKERE
jgi:hypothetical protein